jgi:hypothetical protein
LRWVRCVSGRSPFLLAAVLRVPDRYGCRSETAACGKQQSRRAACVGCEGVTYRAPNSDSLSLVNCCWQLFLTRSQKAAKPEGNKMFKVMGGILLAVVILFSTVFGPPTDRPSLDNLAGSSQDASFGEALAVEVTLSVTDWKIDVIGPVSYAKGTIPFTESTIHFTGYMGKWHISA